MNFLIFNLILCKLNVMLGLKSLLLCFEAINCQIGIQYSKHFETAHRDNVTIMSLQLDVITSNAITFAKHSDPLFQNDGRRGAATEFAVYQNIYRLYLIVAASVSCQDLDLLDLVSS